MKKDNQLQLLKLKYMEFRSIIGHWGRALAALPAIAFSLAALAAQPYGYCWHPADLIKWDGTDPAIRFNRSKTPLRSRAKLSESMKTNSNQHALGQITDASILYPRCSAAPSQGDFTFTGYQPTYWQYIDKLVYWAGSASEGIIIPPPAPMIDAAHNSGVPVLGQLFFPPTYYGGKREWVTQMLTKENGTYPYAVKLFEVARDLGFDGWFINEETGGGSDSDWAGFVAAFNKAADEEGYGDMEIQWYNARTAPNITILNAHPNTSQFLEYGAIGDKRSYATQLKCSPDETFSRLYAGIECAQAGLTGYGSYLNSAFPASGHLCSVALFCPEEHSWKDNVRDILDSEDTGERAYAAVTKVFKDEEKMWVNTKGDPSSASGSWKGISGYIMERTAITSVPFRTDFCVGVGKGKYAEGELLATGDWHHSGVQSVLPTWRWWIENRGSLRVDIDWDDVYSLGNSFHIYGTPLDGPKLMRLYKTEIPVEENLKLTLDYRGATPALALSTEPSLKPDVILDSPVIEITAGNPWRKAVYDLSALKGKTIYMIGFELKTMSDSNDVDLRLGSLAVLPDRKFVSPEVVNPEMTAELGQEKGEISVTWEYEPNEDFDYFEILVKGDDRIIAAGHTRGEGFYFPEIKRPASGTVDIEISAVLKDGSFEIKKAFKADFEELTAPEVRLTLTKSYLRVGEETTITAKATNFPTAYDWTIPTGLELVGYPEEKSVKVKAVEEGTHKVGVKVTNDSGSTSYEVEAVDVLPEGVYSKVENVVRGKKVVDYSSCTNSKETPANLIDGVTNPSSVSAKWCTLDASSWVIFDCGAPYRFYGFKVYDCKSGPEDAENFHSYTIEVSDDGQNWTKIVDETGRQADNIKEDWIVPTEGRYIRFAPTVAGVLRVWEFEAYGLSPEAGIDEAAPDSANPVKNIYTLDGIRRQAPQSGLNIVRFSNGTIEKTLK